MGWVGDVEDGLVRMQGGRGGLARPEADGKSDLVWVGSAIDGAGSRIQLQSQVVARKVVEVVEGVLGQAQEIVGLLVLQLVGLDRDA